jgi:D-cysteine desulfhydrase
MTVTYPKSLQLAQLPTPLVPLDRLSAQLQGPRIWIKRDDLTGSLLSGNKVRKLNYVIAQALADNCDTLITCGGEQSNHCRATAIAGASLGLDVCLILRKDLCADIDGNLLLDQLSGANIQIYGRDEYFKKLPDLFQYWAEHYAKLGKKTMLIPTGASDEIGVWGYVEASRELIDDFQRHKISPRHIYTATGSGGTQAGLTVGMFLYGSDAQVVGVAVCDSESYFQEKVLADLTAWQRRYNIDINLNELSICVNANYIGPGYAVAESAVFETIALLAKTEGIVLDPVYTGKAFHGLVTEIKKRTHQGEDDIVFIHTGGLFGLFAQKQQLLSALNLRS